MALRLDYRKLAPDAVRALAGLNEYSDNCSIAPQLRRLLEIHVSQLNRCSYCIEVHRGQALDLGVSPEKIDALKNWREGDCFSAAEKSALAWASAVTTVGQTGAPDALYEALAKSYSETEQIDLTFIVLAMNAWNRLAIAFSRKSMVD